MTTSTALQAAKESRREVLSILSRSTTRDEALAAIAKALSIDTESAQEVLTAPLEILVGAASTPDLSASHIGDGTPELSLRQLSDSEEHRALFAQRSQEKLDDNGQPWDEDRISAEYRDGLNRVDHETAVWLVGVDTSTDQLVGLVFGEQQQGNDIDVAIWVAPSMRGRGYGMAALREARKELAAYFPGSTLVVRAPASSTP